MKKLPVGHLIKLVHQLNQTNMNAIFAQFDLTATQTFTLIYLFQADMHKRQVHQRDIERDMEISNPTVTGILNRLEQKALIKRLPCPEDARAKTIVVTKKALEMDKILRERLDANDQELTACLSDEEMMNLELYLKKILHHSM